MPGTVSLPDHYTSDAYPGTAADINAAQLLDNPHYAWHVMNRITAEEIETGSSLFRRALKRTHDISYDDLRSVVGESLYCRWTYLENLEGDKLTEARQALARDLSLIAGISLVSIGLTPTVYQAAFGLTADELLADAGRWQADMGKLKAEDLIAIGASGRDDRQFRYFVNHAKQGNRVCARRALAMIESKRVKASQVARAQTSAGHLIVLSAPRTKFRSAA